MGETVCLRTMAPCVILLRESELSISHGKILGPLENEIKGIGMKGNQEGFDPGTKKDILILRRPRRTTAAT